MISLKMAKRSTGLEKLRRAGAALVIGGVLAGGVALARAYEASGGGGPAGRSDRGQAGKTAGADTPIIVILCTKDGFEIPELVEPPSGEYTFVILNRSGYDVPLGIEFARKGEEPIVSKEVPWGDEFIFTVTIDSGAFEIREAARPEWSRQLPTA